MSALDCIFCKIIQREIPAEILWEDDDVLAIRDINPAAPFHILVMPKEHIASMNDLTPAHANLVGHIVGVGTILAKREGLGEPDKGYRAIVNCGPQGGQTVEHLHLHILGGTQLGHLNV